MTAAIGIVRVPDVDALTGDPVKRADSAMYAAKRANIAFKFG